MTGSDYDIVRAYAYIMYIRHKIHLIIRKVSGPLRVKTARGIYGKRRPRSACADAQTDLGLR